MATVVTAAGRVRPKRRPGHRRGMPTAAWWIVCVAFAAMFIYPIYVAIASSLKGTKEAASIPPTLFPHNLSFNNYRALSGSESSVNVFHNIGNSVMVSIGATIATVVIATLGGYAFAKLRFPGSNVVFFATLATFMIPFQAIITPLYIVLKDLGLQNTLLGLGLVYVTFNLPFGLFLMRNSFSAVPSTLEEAALIDGCHPLGAMWRAVVAVGRPPGPPPGRAARRPPPGPVHLLRHLERVLLRADPDQRPVEVHPPGDADVDLQRRLRIDQLGPAAGGRRGDDDPVHRAVPAAAALLRGRPAQRSAQVT